MVTACTVTALFDALSAFQLAHRGVEIVLLEDNSDRLVDSVHAGTTDLALIGAAGSPPTGLESLVVVKEGVVAAVPSGHPLARQRQTTLAEISAYPIVSMPKGAGIRTVFDHACQARKIRADITLQASAPGTVADLAVRGLGVAILSESMAKGYAGRLQALRVVDIETPAVLALIWKTAQSPALGKLLIHCRAAFPDPQR
jgi:DNA-binding transcriptional LysR family regulator